MVFEDIKYTLHASCHGTHAMLNAVAEMRGQSWLRVCDINMPLTRWYNHPPYKVGRWHKADGIQNAAIQALVAFIAENKDMIWRHLIDLRVVEGAVFHCAGAAMSAASPTVIASRLACNDGGGN